jgi:hypothetical protein
MKKSLARIKNHSALYYAVYSTCRAKLRQIDRVEVRYQIWPSVIALKFP